MRDYLGRTCAGCNEDVNHYRAHWFSFEPNSPMAKLTGIKNGYTGLLCRKKNWRKIRGNIPWTSPDFVVTIRIK